MSELKVCAHCGHEAARKELRYYGETETWAYCPNPDCPMHDRTMTIKAWQTRPIEDALNARIAELEAENAALKAKLNAGETVDEWGKPDWVGKDVRK